ncbi:MAG: hypothetical protein LBB26_02775 [Puniceicoccales bacterium]|jgi:hypothetical protein|nr:hypothetical protein [Puniceicoccales bacterium]
MFTDLETRVCSPSCATPEGFEGPGVFKSVVTSLLSNFVAPARAWFVNHRRDILKWLVIGLGIGAVACAASFGLGYLLSYLGVAGASAAVGIMGTRSIGALISAVILGPIRAYLRWTKQTQFKKPLGELPSLFLVNTVSTIGLLPIGRFPFPLGLVNKVAGFGATVLPLVASHFPSFLQFIRLDGRKWAFVCVACLLIKSIITICCFGIVKSGIFLLVNIPTFIMFFVLYYLDRRSNSFIPSVCTSMGVSVASLVASFLL